MAKKVGVLVVDDSPICRQLISDALRLDPELDIVGTAENGREAVRLVKELRPNVVTMDVDMPEMDGLAATEAIMAESPTPILVLTADPRNQAPELTCRALEVGALALQVKPALDAGPEAWNLAREVKLLSAVKVIRHLRGSRRFTPRAAAPVSSPADAAAFATSPVGLVAIASSTGGPQVISKILSELPGDFPAPIAVVQHINPAFTDSLAGWLAGVSKLTVKVAKDGDALLPAEVLIAPSGAHMTVASRGRVAVKHGPPVDGHVPSGTALFTSAAKAYGRRVVGVVLTGMGNDGAEGMVAIRAAGGRTVVQNQDSCVVFGMPAAAIERNAAEIVAPADEIAQTLVRLARGELPPKA